MAELHANLGTDFLFPKLHGMWARSFSGESLQHLVQTGSEDALRRALAPLNIEIPRRQEFQRQLTRHFIGDIISVKRLLDRRTAGVYAAAIDRFFYENVKTMMHCHFFPKHDVDISFLLINAPGLPSFDAHHIAEAKTIHQLFLQIPAHPVRDALLPLLVALDDTRDILTAECHLDRLFYERFRAAAAALPHSMRAAGRSLVGTEIDIANMVMIFRNLDLYALPPKAMSALILQGGLVVGKDRLNALLECSSRAAAVATLPRTYRTMLLPIAEGELYLSENVLWNHLFGLALTGFRDFDRPSLSVVAFPFLKRAEMLNIGRVFEGLHFGLTPSDIMGMMIGVAHV